MKQCSKCEQRKNESEFGNRKASKDGLNGCCKSCMRIYDAKYRVDNRESMNAAKAKYEALNPKKVKESKARYVAANKEKEKIRQALWYIENREHATSVRAKYQLENADRVRARRLKYLAENPGKRKATVAKSDKKHRGKRNASKAIRRAAEKNATPLWADNQYIQDLYTNCREAQSIFGGIGLDVKFHVDHILPLQHDLICGLHVEDNLQILTAQENQSKSNNFTPGSYQYGS